MKMKYNIYLEDTGSGYVFIKNLVDTLFPNTFDVQSPTQPAGNQALYKFLSENDISQNSIVIYDTCPENDTQYNIVNRLRLVCQRKHCTVIEIQCFEQMMLSFKLLGTWCNRESSLTLHNRYMQELSNRANILYYIETHNLWSSYAINNPDSITNNEKCYAQILNSITKDTKFKVQKGKLSKCWYLNCCFEPYYINNKALPDCVFSKGSNYPMAVEKFKQICAYSEWEYIVTRLGKFLERNGIEYHGGTHIE
jgi:hypothetical protein